MNTGTWLSNVPNAEIVTRYLAQLYNIAPEYCQGVIEKMPEKSAGRKCVDMDAIKKATGEAPTFGKEAKFRPSKKMDRLIGKEFDLAVYNVNGAGSGM